MPTAEQTTLMRWKSAVLGMKYFKGEGKTNQINNTYDRFVEHIQAFTNNLVVGQELKDQTLQTNMRTEIAGFYRIVNGGEELPDRWWKIAIKVGKGKNVPDNPLWSLTAITYEDDKREVYNAFLPAYRAIKESHERPFGFLRWIFDHARYTAERDSLRALSGLMQSLTGDTADALDERLAEYEAKVQLTEEMEEEIVSSVEAQKQNWLLEKSRKSNATPTYEEVIAAASLEENSIEEPLGDAYYGEIDLQNEKTPSQRSSFSISEGELEKTFVGKSEFIDEERTNELPTMRKDSF